MLKLHTVQGNFRGVSVLIASDLARANVEPVYMQWQDLKSEANFNRNPLGQLPTLETQEGFIGQTNAILRYIANISNTLYGKDINEQAEIDQWLDYILNNFTPAIAPILFKIWGFKGEQSEETINLSRQATDKMAEVLNEQLKIRTYLVGQSISIADIALFCTIVYAQRCVLDNDFRKKFSHLTRWYENLSNNPVFIKHFGKNRYASKPWF